MNKHDRSPANRKLILLGQTPPPFHGQAVAIQWIVDGMRERVDMVHVPLRFSETVFDNGRMSFRKILHLLSVIIQTLQLLIRHPGSVLYYPPAPASWVPVLRDLCILSIVRPFAGKTIFHFHAHGLGKFLRDRPWLARLTWAWRKPDLAIVLGESCVADAEHLMPKRVAIVPYGIQQEAFPRTRTPASAIRVLYVGMLAESKGIFDILETAAKLRDLNLEFRLVGTYKYSDTQPSFEARRHSLELDDRVKTVGNRSGAALWQEYADADIFFFPTYFESETFGLVTLEAMMHRLPVVASRWRGPRDIVRHEKTGLLCEPRDTAAYADSIRRLAEDQELRTRMGCQGQAICRDQYALDAFLSSLEALFLQECHAENR